MSETNERKQAESVFATLCATLDEKGWKYSKDEEELTVRILTRGDDLPIALRMEVDEDRMLVLVLSDLNLAIPENRRAALAVAVSQANAPIIDGNFDYDYKTGTIVFRMTSSFRNSLISKELLLYMLACSFYMIDEYNDKFLIVAESNMSNDEIVKFFEK